MKDEQLAMLESGNTPITGLTRIPSSTVDESKATLNSVNDSLNPTAIHHQEC